MANDDHRKEPKLVIRALTTNHIQQGLARLPSTSSTTTTNGSDTQGGGSGNGTSKEPKKP